MAQLQTRLYDLSSHYAGTPAWGDATVPSVCIIRTLLSGPGWEYFEKDSPLGSQIDYQIATDLTGDIATFMPTAGGPNTLNVATGLYTFAEGQANRWQTPTEADTHTGFGSTIFGSDKDGEQVELSKLTSVIGTANQIDITQTSGSEVQIGIAADLEFDSLVVNGDAAIHGAVTADGDISGVDVTATGDVSATGKVSGRYLKLDVFQPGDTLPTEPGSLYVYNSGVQTTPKLVTE